MTQLGDRIQSVRSRIADAARRVGRDAAGVRLVAVTKTVLPEVVREAFAAGLTDFGENRWPDARDKIAALPSATWHFIGTLQRNKVSKILPHFSWVHSVDSLDLLDAIARRAGDSPPRLLIEVNVSGENTKRGIRPGDVCGFLREARRFEKVRILGLMTMAPLAAPETTRPVFRALRQLLAQANDNSWYSSPLTELSMGMTNDFEVAVEEGATIVRIGSAIFSPDGT
jgi:pyridoxal phosphate enzyme (YggS family)